MQALLLWQWSTTVQITSAVMLAVFMLVFRRSAPGPVLDLWAGAWLANLGALMITVAYWFGAHQLLSATLITSVYIACKSLFLYLLLAGLQQLLGQPWRWREGGMLAVVLSALLFGLLLDGIPKVGVAQASLIALALGYGSWRCLRSAGLALGWLGCGMALRALLAAAEAAIYAAQVDNDGQPLGGWLDLFLAAHSSFDTGAEWLILLGCVLAIMRQSQLRLEHSHSELFAANRRLQQLAQHDPLTGLANRVDLAASLQRARSQRARLLFFDLDGFKQINDRLGHDVGDDCLRRFADALRQHFADAERRVRYAGDEFLVIDWPRPETELKDRLDAMRAQLAQPASGLPAMEFSVGVRELSGDDDIEATLRQTDAAMYAQKRERRQVAARG
ncbi:MAG TPA: GGDEF domain-containing protein [Arenimonas sp.]|nr:GGDEF domain-containing protein [Arenimonas sp.]